MSSNAPTFPNLAPDYYLKNFRFLLDWVQERYADLLNQEEHHFIQQFYQLSHDAQCLLVRLSSRKGPLFRRDKLSYSEITSIDSAAEQLLKAELLQTDIPIPVEVICNSLTKPEILLLFNSHVADLKQARKEVLVQQLTNQLTDCRTWQEWTSNRFGICWYLDNQSIIRKLLLLFFGNAYQDLTEFVLQDLGIFRYEAYSIDHQHRIFKSRTELDQYQQLIQLREQLENTTCSEELIQLAAQIPHDCASEKLQRRRAKLCNQIAYQLERNNEYDIALALYAQSYLPPARERRIRLLEKQGQFDEAWTLLTQLFEQPINEEELQAANRIAPRLAKKYGTRIEKVQLASISNQHIELVRLKDERGDSLRVEEIVRLSLDNNDGPCVYAENALFGALFGLWLWPEMFRGIEGAFANPFQAAPLDLYQENFARNRPGLNALWASLETDEYRHRIRQTWEEKQGIANHFINWQFINADLLDIALRSIPANHLALIFKRLLFDIKSNRSGLPDLIQFYPAQKSYRMIEVKGPGDRIQYNQQRWLDYFAEQGIPAEVIYVSWQ